MHHSTVEKTLRIFVQSCLYLVVFAPIIMSAKFFFPAIFPKAAFIFFLTELAVIGYVPLAMLSEKFRPRAHIVYNSLIIFGVLVFITSLTGINFEYSFWGNYERMDGIFTWLHLWILIVVMASVFQTKKDWQRFFGIALIPAVIISFYGFMQRAGVASFGPWTIYETDQGRITGTIGNPAFLAVYLLFNITFALTIVIDSVAKHWMRWYAGVMLTVMFTAYIMTGVRGAFVGLVAGVGLFVLGYVLWSSRKEYKKYVIAGLIGFILILGLLSVLRGSNEWVNRNFGRFFTITIADETTQTRLISWRGGLEGFTEAPLFGVGPQKFDVVFNKYFDPEFYTLVGSETWWDRAHNMVIEVLATMGIVGLLSYLGVGLSMLYALWRLGNRNEEARTEVLILGSFLAAYFIQNLFVFDTISSYLVLAVFVAYIVARTTMGEEETVSDRVSVFMRRLIAHDRFRINPQYWAGGLIIAVLVIGPTAFAHNIRVYQHNTLFLDTLANTSRRPVNVTLDSFREVLATSGFDRKEVVIKLGQFMTQYALQNRISVQELHNGFGFVKAEMEKAVKHNPGDVRLLIAYGNALNVYAELLAQQDAVQAGRIAQQAERILLEAVELGPARQQVFYSLANTYMIRGQNDRGVEVLKNAVQIHDGTSQAYWILALGNVRAGNNAGVIEATLAAVERKYGFSSVAEVNNIANAFVAENELERLLTVYEHMVDIIPSGQAYAKLAALLAQMGRTEEALETAAEVIKRDPSLQSQVEDFVRQVQSGEPVNFLN